MKFEHRVVLLLQDVDGWRDWKTGGGWKGEWMDGWMDGGRKGRMDGQRDTKVDF